MRISVNLNSTGTTAPMLNIGSINRKAAKSGHAERGSRTDTLSLSSRGKNNSLLEKLIAQRQHIIDQKNKLIKATAEKGGDMESIQPLLDSYEEQLSQIDQQTAELMAKEMEEQIKKAKERKKEDEPKTEEEIQNERLSDIMVISNDVRQAEKLSSLGERMNGQARAMKTEQSFDRSRRTISLKSKKASVIAKIQSRSAKLTSKSAGSLQDAAKELEESRERMQEAKNRVREDERAERP